MENKKMKIILWATQALILSLEECGGADVTDEEYEKMLNISRETFGKLAYNQDDLVADNQTLLRELLDEALGGK